MIIHKLNFQSVSMKNFSFLVFTPAAVLVLGGCMQQAEEMPQSDFLLKLYKSDSASGKSVSYTDHSLNVNGSAKAVLKYQVKGSRIELQMGIEPGTNVQARMNALLVFKNTPNPLLAAGLYRFPTGMYWMDRLMCSMTRSVKHSVGHSGISVSVQYQGKRMTD